MPAAVRYSVRQELIQLIEQGRDTVLTAPLYRDGVLVAPASGTVTIYDDSNTAIVSAASVTITGSIAEYTVLGSLTSGAGLGVGWRVVWSLTIVGQPSAVVIPQEAALVRYRLRPVISDADIIRRIPALDYSSPVCITSDTTYQDYIDEADTEVQQWLTSLGRRPWLIASPSALRQVWLYAAVSLIFEAVHDHRPNDGYLESVRRYREMYERAKSEARVTFDWDEDGDGDTSDRTALKPGIIWMC
jgi:hypothetical protein